ncbi:CAF17-like 4Fe-4S cluster assembly/insertion protein YgfZ [Anaeromyxobacter oryzae]|uniref:Glycine cleavage system protein T n=1 Tax=Anaeromyxobacter oryzae TaxID=2918170 RepID=A0ABM7X1X7_9BACT|nr:folate-binding protein [Anaeromyxobacter oryzae]BDG05782.1 glycine cleavage system protein T [Anaeromyxobacter oryzae]
MTTPDPLTAARTSLAVGPVLARTFLRATGKDARDYLHRMSTQDVLKLAPGQAAYAAFLNAKGHLLGEGHVLGEADGLLLELDPAAGAETRAHLEKFVIMDDVVFEDVSESLRVLPVLGPDAPARLGDRGGARRVPTARRGAPAIDLWLAPADAETLRAALVADGAAPLTAEDLEVLRILGGVARFGADLDATRLPMEAGLTRAAISFCKGCYIGQEVVLRATARGHLQRGLVQLALPPGAGPGTPLAAGGAEVGVVTSAVDTPEGRVGLGYLRRAYWKEGERVAAGSAGDAVVRKVIVEDGLAGAGPGV